MDDPLSRRPEPIGSDPVSLARWILSVPFPFDDEETALVDAVLNRGYTLEPTSAQELYALRILYWQVVGFCRTPLWHRTVKTDPYDS